jgi:beta-galactosidase
MNCNHLRLLSPCQGHVTNSRLNFFKSAVLLGVLVIAQSLLAAPPIYTPPPTHRADINLNEGWHFIRDDVAGAQQSTLDDANWENINLPHTWNNLDGQDGGTNYYRGIGWYRKQYKVDRAYAGRQLFLKFDGAFNIAEVWVNGTHLGEHRGGFSAFVFDATDAFEIGATNVIAVKVNNAYDRDIPPLSADFTFFGGIYRDVHLLVTDPLQISPLDYGSPGIYLKTSDVTSETAALEVTAVISNAAPSTAVANIRAFVLDADNKIAIILTSPLSLAPATSSNVVMRANIGHPHLWNGRPDPYLYHVSVQVEQGTNVLDLVQQPLGFRSFNMDPDKGFILNGRPYDLHGTAFHQDGLNRGWAVGQEQRERNFALLEELGATALRLSHYEHADQTYDLADHDGIALWSEVPVINNITESPGFYENSKQQLNELIRQRYNHPAVICWGIYNEITLRPGPQTTNLVNQMVALAAQLDSTRPSTCAISGSEDQAVNWLTKVSALNKYLGWYSGKMEDFAPSLDRAHKKYPTHAIGVSEYGVGACIDQHYEEPYVTPPPKGKFHPEEFQNFFHETYWDVIKQRPWLWCKFIWTLADFAADDREEGSHAGRNDKGLVTYDRQIRKDAFYFYQANWTTNAMVYITGHHFTNRLADSFNAKVYANCDSVELFLNGSSQGTRTSTNCIFTWPIKLQSGTNAVHAIGSKGPVNVSDSLTWIAPGKAQ